MANTTQLDALLAWLRQQSLLPWEKTVPVPQSAFSLSSIASSSTVSSAFVDDPPQSLVVSPPSQPPSSSDSRRSSFSSDSSDSSDASPPPQVHAATLRCLTGEHAPPSWFRHAPARLIPTIERRWGPWRASRMDLSHEAESRLAFRDRKLTPAEARVARPCEITTAQYRRGWLPVMRRVWRLRLAAAEEDEAETKTMTKRSRPPRPLPRLRLAAPAPDSPLPPLRPPPVVAHRFPLPRGRENHRSCCGPQTNPSCPFCSQEGVKRAVLDNQI